MLEILSYSPHIVYKISISALVQSEKHSHYEMWRKGFNIGNRPGPLWEGWGEWRSVGQLDDGTS